MVIGYIILSLLIIVYFLNILLAFKIHKIDKYDISQWVDLYGEWQPIILQKLGISLNILYHIILLMFIILGFNIKYIISFYILTNGIIIPCIYNYKKGRSTFKDSQIRKKLKNDN